VSAPPANGLGELAGDGPLALGTLTDGGQDQLDVARAVAAFLSGARRRLDLALYDIRLDPEPAAIVTGAIQDAAARGVALRLAYNVEHDRPIPVPAPSRVEPSLIDALGVPTRAIPGVPDLMHHKYVVRDGERVWTGSLNWTSDAWSRQENVVVTVASPQLAAAYERDFEQLWSRRRVEDSGDFDAIPVTVGAVTARAWFCPGRGDALSHRIAKAIGRARRRVRIASPVITSAPILGTLAQVVSEARVDLAGVVDATQLAQVPGQWLLNGNSEWKVPLLRTVLSRDHFTGKLSTPYATGAVHDYMHAKVTVADDVVFAGSFNLSRSGELNAENVLELHDAALAQRLADYIDAVRARYPDMAPVA